MTILQFQFVLIALAPPKIVKFQSSITLQGQSRIGDINIEKQLLHVLWLAVPDIAALIRDTALVICPQMNCHSIT
jgi:hypothetical protein